MYFFNKNSMGRRIAACCALIALLLTGIPARPLYAQEAFVLPAPGAMIAPTPAHVPALLTGMKVDLKDPLSFAFILDSGDRELEQDALEQGSERLIKYFLTSLAIPENDLWVNLSPYEKDRIMPEGFDRTEMGRDLLGQDYILKQFTASLMDPKQGPGKEFWEKVHARTGNSGGMADIPLDTFNKVWIVPDKAVVYQGDGMAYVLQSHLKVMMEADMTARHADTSSGILRIPEGEASQHSLVGVNDNTSQITQRSFAPKGAQDDIIKDAMRQVIIPAIEREVNEGESFAVLRQVYASLILAAWYKRTLRQSILNREYSDLKKTGGVEADDRDAKEKIYGQYLAALEKGVFNYVQEEYDADAKESVARKYFSGGLTLTVPLEVITDRAEFSRVRPVGDLSWVRGVFRQVMPEDLAQAPSDASMTATREDLIKVPVSVLENTRDILKYTRLFIGRLRSQDALTCIRAVYTLGLLMKESVLDGQVVRGFGVLEKVRELFKSEDTGVRSAVAQAWARTAGRDDDVGQEALKGLANAFQDDDVMVRTMAAEIAGHILEQGGGITATVRHALTLALDDRNEQVREAARDALDNDAPAKTGAAVAEEGRAGDLKSLWVMVQALSVDVDEDIIRRFVRELAKAKDKGRGMLNELIAILDEEGFLYRRTTAVRVLKEALAQGMDIGEDGVNALFKAILDQDSRHIRAAAAEALGVLAVHRADVRVKACLALRLALDDDKEAVSMAAAKALGNALARDVDIGRNVMAALTGKIGHEDPDIAREAIVAVSHAIGARAHDGRTMLAIIMERVGAEEEDLIEVVPAAARVIGDAMKKGEVGLLPLADIDGQYALLQNERRQQEDMTGDDIDLRRALIVQVRAAITGRIDPYDVKYLGQVADRMQDEDALRMVLDILRDWSVNGSSDAQGFLEGRMESIAARRPEQGREFVRISSRDELFIEAIGGSFSQRSLMPFFTGKKFSPMIRARAMRALAAVGYIDPGYANVGEGDVPEYLEWVARVYLEFGLVAPEILVTNLIKKDVTIEGLKARRSGLEALIARRDHWALIRAIDEDEELLLVYYMLYQSPLQYQGTEPLSFDRFRSLVHDSRVKMDFEDIDVVTDKLLEGFVNAGMDRARAGEIVAALLQGRPPLPKDSPYLDVNGDFIPQRVDVLASLGDLKGARAAEDAFDKLVKNMVIFLKINDLLGRLSSGIDKRFANEPSRRSVFKRRHALIVDALHAHEDLTKVLVSLLALNDEVYPAQGRKRDIHVMIAQKINVMLRNIPLSRRLLHGKAVPGQRVSDEIADLDAMDIAVLVHNSRPLINLYRSRQKNNKLTPLEQKIINDETISVEHIVRIFFAELLDRTGMPPGSSLYMDLENMQMRAVKALHQYMKAVADQIDLQRMPQVVYVDFISKFNLVEFFRLADGAHCCLTSDLKAVAQYGPGVYTREMPRYMANATSFWWQVTTEARGGRQIGWFENWFGLEDGKVLVGTERLYMSPSYHDKQLQAAIMAKVEEVLFSTKVTKIAQADWGHRSENSLAPLADYKNKMLDIVKLQSLGDGVKIYEDAVLDTNVMVKQIFKVKERSETTTDAAESNLGGIDLDPDLLELQVQGRQAQSGLLRTDDAAIPVHIENGLFPVIMEITPVMNLSGFSGVGSARAR